MNLATRIERLEGKIGRKREKTYFIGWANHKWREADGLIRNESESIDEFKKRVTQNTTKRFIWVK